MALVVHSLASGSSGNCILVKDDKASVLIDAGIGIRKIVAALLHVGMNPEDLSGILITHEHSDHTRGAVRLARRYGIPIISNAKTLAFISEASSARHKVLEPGEELTIKSLLVRPFSVSHDSVCPVGYTIEARRARVCSATDTGILTPQIRAEAEAADLLILESNHDVEMLRSGPYPWYLKERILGSKGHISNDTAAQLLLDIAGGGKKFSVWLAHLSKTNNTPSVALATARKLLKPYLGNRIHLDVALRDVPSVNWHQGTRSFQLNLFGL